MRSIEFAATNIPLPSFEVTFLVNNKTRLEIEPATTYSLLIDVYNKGYEVAEMIELSCFFPPVFKVRKSPYYQIDVQPKHYEYAEWTCVTYEQEILHAEFGTYIKIKIKSPKEAGTYKIPVYISERKIADEEFELELVVK